ncbi:MAG: FMN-binding protein, partial [Cetobacterium sp.]
MKKSALFLALLSLSIIFTSCNSKKDTERSFIAKAGGFSGEIKVNVTTLGDKIKDVELVSHNETDHIISRAFPILRERILEAQSPIIDSVSGATYTSFGVKRAVNEALKTAGKDFGKITNKTK